MYSGPHISSTKKEEVFFSVISNYCLAFTFATTTTKTTMLMLMMTTMAIDHEDGDNNDYINNDAHSHACGDSSTIPLTIA